MTRDDVGYVINYLMAQQQQRMIQQMQQAIEIQKLESDEMNPDNQKKIEDMIKMQRVQENLEYAQEAIPESFIKVPMLYVDCSVNNVPIHAFVDTGAQSTIMSKSCAEKAGINKIMDPRWTGVAVGVGHGKIIGRVHAAQLEIGGRHFPCAFTIMDSESIGIDLILGLDNLRKHRCCVDLGSGQLSFMNGEVKVPFLAENMVQESFHTGGIPPELLAEEEEKAKAKTSPTAKKAAAPIPPVPAVVPTAVPAARPQAAAANMMEQNIQRLMQEGLSREDAIGVLSGVGGNLEMALMYVLQQRAGF